MKLATLFVASLGYLSLGLWPAARAADYELKRGVEYAQIKPEGGSAEADSAKPFKLLLDAYLPKAEGPRPALLVIHGGAWRSGSKSQLGLYCAKFADQGVACFAINYRLAPKHKFPAQIDDCRTAIRWLLAHAKDYNIDPERIGVIGYSAGGHLAALLGVQGVELEKADAEGDDPKEEKAKVFRPCCVVAGGAPCEFRKMPANSSAMAFWLGGTRAQQPANYENASPTAFVSKDASPIFFYHGEDDALVDLNSPESMVELLTKAGVETQLHVVKGGGHITAIFNPDAFAAASEFVKKHLKP